MKTGTRNAVIFTEAGPTVGLGHLTRCTALYDALSALECSCEMIIAGEALDQVVEDRVHKLADWRSSEIARSLAQGRDIAVIDSYIAGLSVYEAVAQTVGTAVYLDDTARVPYPRGIVVNGNPDAVRLLAGVEHSHTLLAGVEYQLLRTPFRALPKRVTSQSVDVVLVVAGGGESAAVRKKMAEAVKATFSEAAIDEVASPRSAAEMAESMLRADLAVTAAGQSLYELAAAGTPAVALCVAGNQVEQARAFERAGTVVLAGSCGADDDGADLQAGLRALEPTSARITASEAGQELVDGLGAHRVARVVLRQLCIDSLSMRPADACDEAEVLRLANEPSVRGAGFNTDPIPATDHHAWYNSALGDPSRMLLLIWDGQALAGYVRFDISGNEAVVSVALAPQYRGLGIGGWAIECALSALVSTRPDVTSLRAEVRRDNVASSRFFSSLGFALTGTLPDRWIYQLSLPCVKS